jgi:hypothetical protein
MKKLILIFLLLGLLMGCATKTSSEKRDYRAGVLQGYKDGCLHTEEKYLLLCKDECKKFISESTDKFSDCANKCDSVYEQGIKECNEAQIGFA